MHLDEERIQRLVDGELPAPAEAEARRHLGECGECRAYLAAAAAEAEEVSALLGRLDGPAPPADVRRITERARGREQGWIRRAAGLFLALGLAGAVYAMPGSPLRPWVKAAATWVGARVRQEPTPPEPPAAPPSQPAGIVVAPGRDLFIQFTSPQPEGGVRVSLTDDVEVVVQGPLGAATFTSDANRVVVDNRGSTAVFEIRIPDAAPRVEIRLGDRRIFLKEGGWVTTEDAAGGRGPFLLSLRGGVRP
jgi:hypothetical protein